MVMPSHDLSPKRLHAEMRHSDGLSQVVINRIAPLLREGKGDREIQSTLGVSRDTIRKVADTIGLVRRRGIKPAGWQPTFIAKEPTLTAEPFEPAEPEPAVVPRNLVPGPIPARPATQPVTTGGYPLIKGLLGRTASVLAAVKALRDAGMDDLAELALDKAGTLTPLESEVIRFFRSQKPPIPGFEE